MNPIAQVDILAKVIYPQELHNKWDLEQKNGSSRARLFALNSDARLPGIVIWSDRPYLGLFTRGHWNRLKITKHINYMLTKSRACFFWGRRSAAGSSDTDTKGLGILKSMSIHANHLYWFNKWVCFISTSFCGSNKHTDISHAWIFINVILYQSVCPWIFSNVIFY